MKTSIRTGVFETNSSSTHSLTIETKENYEAWQNGELFFDMYDDRLVTEEEIRSAYEKELLRFPDQEFEEFKEENYQTFDEYEDEEYLDSFRQNHTTKSGDEIVVFGKYGQEN
jgi:hypothetical protein